MLPPSPAPGVVSDASTPCCSVTCGAAVVVNDRGVASDGTGGDTTPAEEVAAEIRARGGRAVASDHDVASWDGAQATGVAGDL